MRWQGSAVSTSALSDGRGCAPQGYGIGRYDILFATNVLHATRDMGVTLRNCKALLRAGGLLIANELSAKTEFLTLTFGLTKGWWLYDDAQRRIPGPWPLPPDAWQPLLPFSLLPCHVQVSEQFHCPPAR